ncbi:quorum-quenching N-acyl homoserine lactonase AiiA [Alicyclobacillus mengziensis]|uniref:quorum-quenching N-acyl-homoserine lactonase n=1 Tax=Alicyclobacillus mengziensis TaxID=2931921 RepID=A0A9X7VYJ3_9BACL|nr:N-acyl homoserine lactonase family protein [Alicyclobacillus mengziensis]QSO47152.1 N-acyl homoserine lactonase family protein [Alicyclobacillus mengziensis]
MPVNSLSLLPLGRCLVDNSMLDTRQKPGQLTNLPIWSYLIETPSGPILIDTGMPDFCIDNQDLFRQPDGSAQIVPIMTAEDTITKALNRAGYQPEDLRFVISTHWHFDHAGGNTHFKNTEIVVQRAEYQAAMEGEGYPDVCRDPDLHYRIIEGDVELAPGVQVLFTPGHSHGHQSVFVETKQSGPLLLTIDASYYRGNYEEGVPFAGVSNSAMVHSIAKLRDVAKASGAFVFFGHDTEQEKQVRVFPERY